MSLLIDTILFTRNAPEKLNLSIQEKYVLICIASHIGDSDGWLIRQIQMAKECSISVRQIRRFIKSLIDKKILLIEKIDTSLGKQNFYKIDQNMITYGTPVSSSAMESLDTYGTPVSSSSPTYGTPVSSLSIDKEHKKLKNNNKCEVAPPPSDQPFAKKPNKNDSQLEIQELFAYWQRVTNHPNAKLDKKRSGKISEALKLGYTIENLKQAIDGCANTPFNMGQNDRGQKYDDIELILRSASHIDRFMANAVSPPVPIAKTQELTPYRQSQKDFMDHWKLLTSDLRTGNEH